MLSTPIGRLRLISVLEAVTYLVLLFIAVPVKYGADRPVLVQIMGPVHGTFFILYVIQALDVRSKLKWDGATTAKVLVAAVIPFAPFFVERWLRTQVPGTAAPASAKT
jgi:integral membrane protein